MNRDRRNLLATDQLKKVAKFFKVMRKFFKSPNLHGKRLRKKLRERKRQEKLACSDANEIQFAV